MRHLRMRFLATLALSSSLLSSKLRASLSSAIFSFSISSQIAFLRLSSGHIHVIFFRFAKGGGSAAVSSSSLSSSSSTRNRSVSSPKSGNAERGSLLMTGFTVCLFSPGITLDCGSLTGWTKISLGRGHGPDGFPFKWDILDFLSKLLVQGRVVEWTSNCASHKLLGFWHCRGPIDSFWQKTHSHASGVLGGIYFFVALIWLRVHCSLS